jgi:hypothetical protein
MAHRDRASRIDVGNALKADNPKPTRMAEVELFELQDRDNAISLYAPLIGR